MNSVSMKISVPVCSFRKPYAREYLETERFPPPSTVYGFLLSLVGEEDRNRYISTRLAIALTKEPEVSKVLRTTWRIKNRNNAPGMGSNRRPDYQELLTGLELFVWVYKGKLAKQLLSAGSAPEKVDRYGGLCLGESRDLVNDVIFSPGCKNRVGAWLVRDKHGHYPLPVWVDHVGSKNTNWGQFTIKKAPLNEPEADSFHWIEIAPGI